MSQQCIEPEGPDSQFRRLIEAITGYAICMLDAEGVVVGWNSLAARLDGYADDEIVGHPAAILYPAEDQRAGRPAAALASAVARGRYVDEGWRVRKDGSRFWASTLVDPIRDEAGQVQGFALITRDITDQFRLRQTTDELHHAHKMAVVGRLAAGVAHDVNNLLATLIGCLDLIAAGRAAARTGRLVRSARRAADRGVRLVGQLIAFAHRQVPQPQPSDVNALLMAVETLLAHACGEAIEVNFDLQPSLPSCTIEPAQFTSLLLDLVMNGRDAMPRGGTLTVQTRTVVLNAAEAARLDDIAAGECIVVAVSDTGEGLVRDVRARAMDPFFTTRGAEAASGLGLSQVHDFVRRSGGRIEIESEPHEGTTVSLYLPVCDNVTAQAGGLAPITVHDRAAVLVVEDDPDLLEITIEAMRGFGYKVHHARDAAAGLAILDENPGFGLLFTDVVLPHGCDGVELARRAQLLRPTMHILLASGYPRAFLRDRAGLQDSMAFIAKPYSMSTLNLTLKLLAQAASRPSSPPN